MDISLPLASLPPEDAQIWTKVALLKPVGAERKADRDALNRVTNSSDSLRRQLSESASDSLPIAVPRFTAVESVTTGNDSDDRQKMEAIDKFIENE